VQPLARGGRIAVGAAGRAAAGAAGRAGAGTVGQSAAGMAGRAGGRMAFGQGVRGVLGMFDGGSAPPYSEMEASQQSFLERMNAGEEISDDELADAPAGHVPEQLMQRRTTAQFSRMVSASMSSGGAGAGGSGSPPVVQPGRGSLGPPLFPPTGTGAAPPPGGGGAGGSGGAMAVLNSAGPAIGGFVGAIVRATAATVAAVQGLNLMNTGVIALNRELAQYDGNLAQAYAQYDVDELQRGVRRSETMSGPLTGLLKEQSELRDGVSEVSNEISAGFAQTLGKVTSIVNYANKAIGVTENIADGIQAIREWLFGKDDTDLSLPPWRAFFADVSDGKFDGKRPDFGGPKDIFPKRP